MAYDDEIEQKITGRTYEECKEKLFNQYGKNFRITDRVTDFRPGGFLHLQKRPVTVVTYVVNHQKSYSPESSRSSFGNSFSAPFPVMDRTPEEEQLARSREQILQNQSSVMLNSQMKEMSKSIEELKNEMYRSCPCTRRRGPCRWMQRRRGSHPARRRSPGRRSACCCGRHSSSASQRCR